MKSYNFIKRELYYMQFSGYFPRLLVQQFQSTFIKASVVEFKRILGCRLQFHYYQNMTAAETIPSKFWRWDYPYKNCVLGIPIATTTYNISEKKLFIDISHQVNLENVKFEQGLGLKHIAMVISLVKKTLLLDMLRQIFHAGIPL